MKVIGITGGIGCGKSTLVSMIKERCNCLVIETDSVAKYLMSPGRISYKLIVEYFGEFILREDKSIDSKKLSPIVMNDKKKLEMLNSFTHPYVEKELKDIIKRESENYDAIIIESALLLDTPIKNICDEIWNVSANMKNRIERLSKYRGYSKEEAENIIRNQRSEQWYSENTTRTFVNDLDNGAGMLNMLEIVVKELKGA